MYKYIHVLVYAMFIYASLACRKTVCVAQLIKLMCNTFYRMSSLKVLSSVMRDEGIRGLYRGYSSTLIRDPGGYFFFFFGYEFTRKALTPKDSQPGYNKYSKRITLSI